MADPGKIDRPPVLTTGFILEVILMEERTEEDWCLVLEVIADRANRNMPLGGSPWPPSEEERERMLRTIQDVVRACARDPSGCGDGSYRFRIEESYFDGKPLLEFQKLATLELCERCMRLQSHIARRDLPQSSTPLQALACIRSEHDLLARMINDRPGRQNDGPYRFRIEESYFDGEPFIAFQKLTTLELLDRYSRLRTHIARHDLPPTSTPLHRLAWIEYEHDLLFRMIEGRDSRSRRVEDRANQITPVPVTRIEAGEGEETPPERLKGLEDDTPEKRKKSEAKR